MQSGGVTWHARSTTSPPTWTPAQLPHPRSIDEQLALHVAIGGAQTAMLDHDYDVAALPQHPADPDWQRMMIDELLPDPRGINAVYSTNPADVAAFLASAPIDTWFHTLPNQPARVHGRGYRR